MPGLTRRSCWVADPPLGQLQDMATEDCVGVHVTVRRFFSMLPTSALSDLDWSHSSVTAAGSRPRMGANH